MPEDLTLPEGFLATGLHCGIKDDPQKLDLALFVSETPCTAAGVFTRNRVCGAPVKVSRERVPRATARAVLVSSGNANACTGERGIVDARWMTAELAARLGCPDDDVLVCSTGVIGRFLPRERLEAGIPRLFDALAATPGAFEAAARGMMTTDTFHKQSVRETQIDGARVRISGAAKGAAMIAPDMGTMLAVIMTDAALTTDQADAMLRHAVDRSFNCISVEGHTSTSDSVVLVANGHSPLTTHHLPTLQQALTEVCTDLARQIVRDAEGADHLITIDVRGVRTRDEGRRIAKTIAESPLVKTAITGADPNWGRIVSAAGYSGVELAEEDVSLKINGTPLYEKSNRLNYDEAAVSAGIRNNREVSIELELPYGNESVRFWTSDLTAEYVRLNAEYTT